MTEIENMARLKERISSNALPGAFGGENLEMSNRHCETMNGCVSISHQSDGDIEVKISGSIRLLHSFSLCYPSETAAVRSVYFDIATDSHGNLNQSVPAYICGSVALLRILRSCDGHIDSAVHHANVLLNARKEQASVDTQEILFSQGNSLNSLPYTDDMLAAGLFSHEWLDVVSDSLRTAVMMHFLPIYTACSTNARVLSIQKLTDINFPGSDG